MSQQPRGGLSHWSATLSNHVPSVCIGGAIVASAWHPPNWLSGLSEHGMEMRSALCPTKKKIIYYLLMYNVIFLLLWVLDSEGDDERVIEV